MISSHATALPHLRALLFSGKDALAFCQSQVISDLNAIHDSHWHPSAWCNASGKVRTTLLVQVNDHQCRWILPTPLAEAMTRALHPFTIGRQVHISEPQAVIGHWRANAGSVLSYDARRQVVLASGNDPCWDDPALLARWHAQDIACGMAWVSDQLTGQYLPQELGFERFNAISYKKGCYPGQEVIAKLHYRGTVKKRLCLVNLAIGVMDLTDSPQVFDQPTDSSMSPAPRACGQLINWTLGQGLAVVAQRVVSGHALWIKDRSAPIGTLNDFELSPSSNPVS